VCGCVGGALQTVELQYEYAAAANHLYDFAQAARLRASASCFVLHVLRATEAPTPVALPRRQWAFRLQTPLRALTEAMLDAMPTVR
jgi:hypothetical protein